MRERLSKVRECGEGKIVEGEEVCGEGEIKGEGVCGEGEVGEGEEVCGEGEIQGEGVCGEGEVVESEGCGEGACVRWKGRRVKGEGGEVRSGMCGVVKEGYGMMGGGGH